MPAPSSRKHVSAVDIRRETCRLASAMTPTPPSPSASRLTTAAMTQPGVLGFSASTSPQPTPDVNVITSGGPALVNNTEQGVKLGESDGKPTQDKADEQTDVEPVVLGVCAMDVKARSKAMREILTRLVEIEKGGVNVKLFGDMVILEEGKFPARYPEIFPAANRIACQTSPTGRPSTSSSPSSPKTFPSPKRSPTPKSPTLPGPRRSRSTRSLCKPSSGTVVSCSPSSTTSASPLPSAPKSTATAAHGCIPA